VPVSRCLVLVTVAGTVLVASVRADAQPTPSNGDDPVLAALVEEALALNPDVKGARETVTAARSRPDQARSLANPMLAVGYTNDGWAPTLGSMPMTTFAFMATQDLPRFRPTRSSNSSPGSCSVPRRASGGRTTVFSSPATSSS